MDKKELLHDWLINLYASLKEKNKKIKELETQMSNRDGLHEIQLSRLENWVASERVDPDVKEELKYSKDFVEKLPSDQERKLSLLNKSKKATMFMISEIEKELRDL